MGLLEERIVASLVKIRRAEPDCARHMFVFPTTLMTVVLHQNDAIHRTVVEDAVTMICRPAVP